MSEKGIVKAGETRGEVNKRIENDAKLNVGIIAVGNGGGSVGRALHDKGFEVQFINTSVKDMDSEVIPDNCQAWLIDDASGKARGAGRNRGTMLNIYDAWNKDTLFKNSVFDNFILSKDIIFVVATTAGGTGSGLTPTLVDNIMTTYPGKAIIPIGILPRLSESVRCHLNTEQFFDEINMLVEENSISYMAFDLEKYADKSIDDGYKAVAKDIVESVSVISGSMAAITRHGMIDERDLLTIITAPGMMNVYSGHDVELTTIEEKGVQNLILEAIKNTSAVQIQKDKMVEYFGLYVNMQAESSDPVVRGDYSILENALGKPLDTFVNYATNDSSYSEFGLIVSGLSVPIDRLNLSVKEAEKHARRKTKELNLSNIDDAYAADDNKQIDKLMNSSKAVKTTGAVSVSDKFRNRRAK